MTEVPTSYYTIIGIVSTIEFAIGTPLNMFCVWYFVRKSRSTQSAVNSLFVAISTVDFMLSSIMAVTAVAAFSPHKPGPFGNVFICNAWGLVWHTGAGLSIFLVAVLAITRWKCMVFPLSKTRRGTVRCAIIAYTIVQLFKATMNYWYNNGDAKLYKFNKYVLGCSVSVINPQQITNMDKLLYFLIYICETLVPAVPVVGFSVATVVSLRKSEKMLQDSSISLSRPEKKLGNSIECSRKNRECSRRNIRKKSFTKECSRKEGSTSWEKRRHATVTVLLLILVFVICNVWFWAFLLGDAVYVYSDGRISYVTKIWGDAVHLEHDYWMTYAGVYMHTIILNSTTNAVIYFIRLEGLRCFAREQIGTATRKIKLCCMGIWLMLGCVKRREYDQIEKHKGEDTADTQLTPRLLVRKETRSM